jgi:MFS family permease
MNKNFKLLWTSQMLSQITVNMMNFLFLARIYTVTGSSIATSLLWISYALPAIFFGPIGAATVDLVNRKKILVITNLLQALTVFAYIFLHTESIFLLYAVVIVYSLLNQFYVPAESATLPSVVSRKKLAHANSLFFLTQQVSLIVGFGLAGIIQKLIGFNGSLILCSSFLFIAFLSVYFLPNLAPTKKIPENFEDLLRTFFDHIIEGYRFIKNKKTVLYPLSLLFLIQVGLTMIIINLPIIAGEILKVSISYVGLLVVVPAGVGAILGSIYVNKLIKDGWRKKKIIDISLLVIVISVFTISLGLSYIPSVVRFIAGPILVTLVGIGFVGVNIPTLTYLQEVTPEWLRGRVFGNLWFLITIATIFPVMFSGVISEFFGVRTLLTLLALGSSFVLYFSIKKGQKMIEDNF